MTQLNKKKVLIFTPGGVGGAERMSVLIGKILPKDSFSVKYVVVGKLRNIYNIIPKGFDVDCIPVHNIYCFSTFRIWWKIIREKPDVVFSSQVAYNPRVIIAAKLAGRKVVIRSSGMIGHYRKRMRGVKVTYPWANKLVAQQEDMREEMIRLLNVPPNKVVAIYNPLDTSDINSKCTVPSPFSNLNDVNYVQTASVCHRKAQDVSIRALAIVKQSIPNAHLYFIGGYDEKSDYYQSLCKLIAQLNLQDCVHFVGYDKNPYRWVKNAGCFVFPSRIEGLPNALIEASYLGVPCTAARCLNVVDDIIKSGKNGYVVNVDDVEGMAHGMIDAIKLKNCTMIYKPGTPEEFTNLFNSI